MFWKVTGFSQPSPIEQILDKDEFTLEELLDEDDIIQECKSLNGRLIAFLREKGTVEQLIRYLVEPSNNSEDPKRQYKYPFTACEVFCCEVEAVFNTLLEESELTKLLFSLLDAHAPLNCKTAGYFGRVVGHLLIRKTNEMMQYLRTNPLVLEKLIGHVDTTSISDIVKRLVGADEQASMQFLPAHTQWLSDTPLVDMLLERLGTFSSSEVQANAADILCAIAHSQPSALATKLMKDQAVSALFEHALAPGGQVLVPALDVCIALLEPKRNTQEIAAPQVGSSVQPSPTGGRPRVEAVCSILHYVAPLVEVLKSGTNLPNQETPYGLLSPPLGRARLKIAELLAVLLRTGEDAAEKAAMDAEALPLCMQLFFQYPFNNLLHHHVADMIIAALLRSTAPLITHLFDHCKLLDWIVSIPTDVTPTPRPGGEELAAQKLPIRAGYLGHVTQISNKVTEASTISPALSAITGAHEGWQKYVHDVLGPRNEIENVQHWACGRPAPAELGGIDSDTEDYENGLGMDLESAQGMQPVLYHRYGVMDDHDDDDDDEAREAMPDFSSTAFNAAMITEGISGLDLNDAQPVDEQIVGDDNVRDAAPSPRDAQGGATSHAVDIPTEHNMEDDEVLLASSDDDELGSEDLALMKEGQATASGEPSPACDDMVIVEEEIAEAADNADTPASETVNDKTPQVVNTSKEFSDLGYWRNRDYGLDQVPEDA